MGQVLWPSQNIWTLKREYKTLYKTFNTNCNCTSNGFFTWFVKCNYRLLNNWNKHGLWLEIVILLYLWLMIIQVQKSKKYTYFIMLVSSYMETKVFEFLVGIYKNMQNRKRHYILALWLGEQLRPNFQKGCQQILENANSSNNCLRIFFLQQTKSRWMGNIAD